MESTINHKKEKGLPWQINDVAINGKHESSHAANCAPKRGHQKSGAWSLLYPSLAFLVPGAPIRGGQLRREVLEACS